MYKILMLEDDPFLLFKYVDTLQDNGFIVESTSDVETFYHSAIANDYDAIISDVCLPSNDFLNNIESMGGWRTGLAICKKIRFKGSDAKLIALTNSTLPEVVEWFSQDESVAYINKSAYPPLEFSIALRNILDNPDFSFGELDENNLQSKLIDARNIIPNSQNDIIEKLDNIIDALKTDNSKSFKSSVADFISIAANIASIVSSTPIVNNLIALLKKSV